MHPITIAAVCAVVCIALVIAAIVAGAVAWRGRRGAWPFAWTCGLVALIAAGGSWLAMDRAEAREPSATFRGRIVEVREHLEATAMGGGYRGVGGAVVRGDIVRSYSIDIDGVLVVWPDEPRIVPVGMLADVVVRRRPLGGYVVVGFTPVLDPVAGRVATPHGAE